MALAETNYGKSGSVVVRANLSFREEEADGSDGADWWRPLIDEFLESAAFHAPRQLRCGAGFVVAAGEFAGIDQGQGAGGHGERDRGFGHEKAQECTKSEQGGAQDLIAVGVVAVGFLL